MIVTLKDGSKKEYAEAKSVIDIAYDISEGLARAACAGEVNGEVVDLRTVIDSDCELNILTAKDEKGLAVLRHTASHVLAQAVQTLFPDAKVAIGPSIDTGFYYDFDCPPFSRDDLDAIQQKTGVMPLVLHGGTGIPAEMVKKAITLGVAKVNVNTECQLAFQEATRKYIEAGKDLEGKGFDPRKLLNPGFEAIKATVKEKMELFGSVGKAE